MSDIAIAAGGTALLLALGVVMIAVIVRSRGSEMTAQDKVLWFAAPVLGLIACGSLIGLAWFWALT